MQLAASSSVAREQQVLFWVMPELCQGVASCHAAVAASWQLVGYTKHMSD